MALALQVRLRPSGPWRFGPGDGGRDRLDTLFRSDRLYSALTLALGDLGRLDEWLEDTARARRPRLAVSSLYPFSSDTPFVTPPGTLWPPPPTLLTASSAVFLTKVKWSAARFVPLSVVDSLMAGEPLLADQWVPDVDSGCLLRRDRPQISPYRAVVRASVPVDRLSSRSGEVQTAACLDFQPGAGLWTTVRFSDATALADWQDSVKAAFRLLADSGLGGRRSSGWGHAEPPEFETGGWPGLLLPKLGRHAGALSSAQWLLSLYSPGPDDRVNWREGHYATVLRGGYAYGSGATKRQVRMVAEGSVLHAAGPLAGRAVDVAPEGSGHPVYRAGFALAVALPGSPAPVLPGRDAEKEVPPAIELEQAAMTPVSQDVVDEHAAVASHDGIAERTTGPADTGPRDTVRGDAPALDQPAGEQAAADEQPPGKPAVDEPPSEDPGLDEPPSEDPGLDEPPSEDPGLDEPPGEDPQIEEPEREPESNSGGEPQ